MSQKLRFLALRDYQALLSNCLVNFLCQVITILVLIFLRLQFLMNKVLILLLHVSFLTNLVLL